MKKLSGLLAVSLVAVMMVPAARADIASTEYVNKNMEAKANKVTDTDNYTGDADSPDKYPSMAVANQMAKKAAAQNAAGKLDKVFAKNQNQVMVTDAKGTVTPTTVDTVGTGNAVTAVTVADGKYTVNKGTTFATKEALDTVQTTADNTASAVNNATTGLAATKAIADKNKTDIASMDTAYKAADTAINDKIGTVATGKTVVQMIEDAKTFATYDDAAVKADIKKKQDKLVASGENANIEGSNGVSVSIGTDGKITVKGNQAAINTALAGKQDKLGTDQLSAVNSGITKDKVATYNTAVTTANNALPKATYDSQVGTVSAANMGTNAATVVGAIKEIKSAVSATDGATVKTDQGTTNKDKAVITNSTGKVTTGQIATGMIANGAVNADKIAASAVTSAKISDSAVTTDKIAASAVTSAKIADGTIVNADISDSAAIAQSKISGLTDALATKFVAPGTSVTSKDGTYTLTMKVADGKPTYAWEEIGR